MKKYILNRTLLGIITIAFVLIFVFVSARLTGNPAQVLYPDGLLEGQLEAFNAKYGLDKPFHEQFIIYLQNLLDGDFGMSIIERRPVEEVVLPRIGETLKLGIWALILSALLGFPLGILTALYDDNKHISRLNDFLSSAYAIPSFVFALLLIFIFSFKLKILPSQGASGPLSYIMPAICIALKPIISIQKHVRSGVLQALDQAYIETSIAKGMGRNHTITRHALKNALIPIITVFAGVIVDIIAGSATIETVFSWPGVGQTLIESVLNRDYPVIQFTIIILSLAIVFITYTLDILYYIADPRIGSD